ncbi:MAG: class I tRNA ligase family protein, partial [Fimbriimonas sp.]
SRLAATEEAARKGYETFDVQSVCQALYRFFWGDVCDWYIEVSKSRLNDPAQRETPQWVLLTAFEAFLKMLHPVMPHLTEELYSYLPISGKAPFLMSASWPSEVSEFAGSEAEGRIERVFEAVRTLRALRAGLDIAAMRPIPTAYYEGDLAEAAVLRSQAWVEDLRVGRPPEGERFVSATSGGVDLHLPISGLVDLDKMLLTLEREETKVTEERGKLAARLENPQFVERAKPEVIERDRAALAELDAKLAKLAERRALFA